MDGFPSGQRGQTVNLLQIASVVRIHLHPSKPDVYRPVFDHSVRWCGGIGRRKGLKIPRGQPRAGSSPATSSRNSSFCRNAKVTIFFQNNRNLEWWL